MKAIPKSNEPAQSATPALLKFIAHNKKFKIVQGERLTPEGTEVITMDDFKRADRCRYIFSNGSRRTLKSIDQMSMPEFKADWGFD